MDIEYKIKTSAELAGAEAAADSLERQIGKAKALKQDYSELDAQLKTMRGSIEEAKTSNEEFGKVNEDAGEKIHTSAGKHQAFRMILGELNRVTPGLGHATHLLSEAYLEAGAAAETGAVGVAGFSAALSALLISLGPLIIVGLAIEAAMKYWDMYKESVEQAAEANAKAMDKIRSTTHEALVENEDYQKAMEKASEPHDKYAAALEREEAVFNAQIKSKRELMKLAEQDALAKAKTPEEREAIKQKYAGIEAGLESDAETGKADLLKKTIADIDAEMAPLLEQREIAERVKRGESARGDFAMEERTNAFLKSIDEKLVALQEKRSHYSEKLGTDEAVHDVNEDARLKVQKHEVAKEQVDTGIEIADNIQSGTGATQQQQQYIMQLASKIAGHTVNLADAVKVMETAAHSPAAFVEQVNRAAKALAGFNPKQTESLKEAVDRLEKQVAQLKAAVDHH